MAHHLEKISEVNEMECLPALLQLQLPSGSEPTTFRVRHELEILAMIISCFHLLTEIIGAARHTYDADILEMTIEDHMAILDGLKLRDANAASKAMVTHIRNSRQITLSQMSSPLFPLTN